MRRTLTDTAKTTSISTLEYLRNMDVLIEALARDAQSSRAPRAPRLLEPQRPGDRRPFSEFLANPRPGNKIDNLDPPFTITH